MISTYSIFRLSQEECSRGDHSTLWMYHKLSVNQSKSEFMIHFALAAFIVNSNIRNFTTPKNRVNRITTVQQMRMDPYRPFGNATGGNDLNRVVLKRKEKCNPFLPI